jgi:hypothetical protein
MPDPPLVASPGVQYCWQIMTELHIATRADAIDYLRFADRLPRLSMEELRSLVEAFPLMADDQTRNPAVPGLRKERHDVGNRDAGPGWPGGCLEGGGG